MARSSPSRAAANAACTTSVPHSDNSGADAAPGSGGAIRYAAASAVERATRARPDARNT
ncbi:hypothetical protein [Micromonospora sp. WMMD708]|uniref:hypothetical protein n=1 Tax=Micromonospora sp. WMMD708 TaxID=3403464 RepID=UPI003BF60873